MGWEHGVAVRSRALGVVAALVALVVLVALPGVARASAPASVLVIGDSLSVQAAPAVPQWEAPGSDVVTEAGIGTAPCDWQAGYYDAWWHRFMDFYTFFDQARPRAVVFAFTGNAGVSGPAAGCVGSSTDYSLQDLLTSYAKALTSMADYASQHGAAVFFSATPPRNPATPPGTYSDGRGHTLYGYNGVPQINDLYQAMGLSGQGIGWHYDVSAALGVSEPGLDWTLDLPCQSWDTANCHHGQVQVRAGGFDSIHLDPNGAGAVRYALGLMRQPLLAEGYHPRG
jgi:hypothetical protein